MEIAIPHTGKVVLRYLNETLQNQVFQILFFFCLFVISLCWTLHISRTTMRGSCWVLFCCMGLVFFFPFHHSPLSRLHRNRGTIITSDFDKCLGPDLNSSFNFSSLLTQILSYQDNFKTTSSLLQSHLPKSGQTKKLFFSFFLWRNAPLWRTGWSYNTHALEDTKSSCLCLPCFSDWDFLQGMVKPTGCSNQLLGLKNFRRQIFMSETIQLWTKLSVSWNRYEASRVLRSWYTVIDFLESQDLSQPLPALVSDWSFNANVGCRFPWGHL